MLLRDLKPVILKKSTMVKQPNGSKMEIYEIIDSYKVQVQELDDDISANLYGASIYNMLRLKSPLSILEKRLKGKFNNRNDNISNYYIFIPDVSVEEVDNMPVGKLDTSLLVELAEGCKYKIKSVTRKGIDIERV